MGMDERNSRSKGAIEVIQVFFFKSRGDVVAVRQTDMPRSRSFHLVGANLVPWELEFETFGWFVGFCALSIIAVRYVPMAEVAGDFSPLLGTSAPNWDRGRHPR